MRLCTTKKRLIARRFARTLLGLVRLLRWFWCRCWCWCWLCWLCWFLKLIRLLMRWFWCCWSWCWRCLCPMSILIMKACKNAVVKACKTVDIIQKWLLLILMILLIKPMLIMKACKDAVVRLLSWCWCDKKRISGECSWRNRQLQGTNKVRRSKRQRRGTTAIGGEEDADDLLSWWWCSSLWCWLISRLWPRWTMHWIGRKWTMRWLQQESPV